MFNEEQIYKVRDTIHNYIDNGEQMQDLFDLIKTIRFPHKYR